MVAGRTEPAAWRCSSTLGSARKSSDTGQPARGPVGVGDDALAVETRRPTVTHQLTSVDEYRVHVAPARGVDEIGDGIVPGLKTGTSRAHRDDVRPLARLEGADEVVDAESACGLRRRHA